MSFRPKAAVTAEAFAPFVRVHEPDTVDRMMSPGSSASGSLSRPDEAWNSQAAVGLNQTRPANESSRPKSKFHRRASGSRPLKSDPSRVHLP